MDIIDERRVVIQPLNKAWYGGRVAAVDMLRLDVLHPIISGNKWYKLRLNVLHARENGFKTLVTFGGGFSNHLAATAYAAKVAGLGCVGIIRGNYPKLTPTLEECRRNGMELIFITRADYNRKDEPEWVKTLVAHFDDLFIIPEGGANEPGRKGAELICRFIKPDHTHIAVSVGSGTTLEGIRNGTVACQEVMGFAPMKQGIYLKEHIEKHLHADKQANWQLFDTWHFGGFARWNEELVSFMNTFYETNHIPLDMVYTAKMMYGIKDMLNSGAFAPGARILCIHTGGLQGNVLLKDRLIQPYM